MIKLRKRKTFPSMVGTNRVKKLSKRERVLLILGNETYWSLLDWTV